jgi:protein gp37
VSKTSIEWTDATWNPTRGCSRVSEGCRNCYAERIAARFSGLRMKTVAKDVGAVTRVSVDGEFSGFAEQTPSGPRWTGKVELIPEKLDEPLHWKKPRRVFVNSMSDLFHESLPFHAIDDVFDAMLRADQHTYQILTKRPQRMYKYFDSTGNRAEYLAKHRGIWLGVSVENQETADDRIPLLLQTPAAVRFVSYEPALGPVDFEAYVWRGCIASKEEHEKEHAGGLWCDERSLDWIIVGGESGPGARPFNLEWARSAIAQCEAAGVACFVKQLGAKPIDPDRFDFILGGPPATMVLKDRKGGDWNEWPSDLRVREFPERTK